MNIAKIREFLRKILIWLKAKLWAEGGLAGSHWNRLLVITVIYSLYAILKKNGWWFKKSVKGKHIFLTGAGSGLGRAVAIKMARLGAKLTLVDINEKTVEQTKRMIKA